MQIGEVRIGQVVHLDGRIIRRYIVTAIMPLHDDVNLRALSGASAGSGPSGIRSERLTLSLNQTILFAGADRRKRRADVVRALQGVGKMTVRQEGSGIVVGGNIDTLIQQVAYAPEV